MSEPLRKTRTGLLIGAGFLALALLGFVPSPQADRTSQTPVATVTATLLDASVARASAADKAKSLTFDDLKFEMKKEEPFLRSMLTEKIEGLHGQAMTIKGWILPTSTFQLKGIKNFILVRDNQECCFGPGAALYDSIQVDMDLGKSVDFTTRPIAVEGVFSIREFKVDDKVYSIYHLQAVKAK